MCKLINPNRTNLIEVCPWILIQFCMEGKRFSYEKLIFPFLTRISSKNNSRKEISITKNETNDPHVQQVTLLDDLRYYGVYEVMFTDEELHSNGTFCKGISKIVKIIYCKWLWFQNHEC